MEWTRWTCEIITRSSSPCFYCWWSRHKFDVCDVIDHLLFHVFDVVFSSFDVVFSSFLMLFFLRLMLLFFLRFWCCFFFVWWSLNNDISWWHHDNIMSSSAPGGFITTIYLYDRWWFNPSTESSCPPWERE